jgi:hypothetical protein
MNVSQRLSAATSVLAISVAISSAAAAQGLPAAIPGGLVETTAPFPTPFAPTGAPSAPVIVGNDVTGVSTSTITTPTSSTATYNGTSTVNVLGQSAPLSATAVVTTTNTSISTTTSTPNGVGGFNVSDPVPTTGTPDAPVTSGFSVSASSLEAPAVLSNISLTTTEAVGNDAELEATVGVVSTSSVNYANLTGTATFDPATGDITTAVTGGTATTLDAAGLTTLGADFRGVVNAASQNSGGFFVSAASPATFEEDATVNYTIKQVVSGTTVDSGVTYTDVTSIDFVDADGAPAEVISALETAGFTFNAETERYERLTADFVAPTGPSSAEEFTALTSVAVGFSEDVPVTIPGTTLLPAGPTLSSQLTAAGLATTGSVSATSIDVNGGTISNVADGVAVGDAVNVGQLTAEATTRAADDATLQANIDAEATTRAADDATLQANIDAEATTRAAEDTVLRTAIATEVTDRTAADTVLRTAIATEVTDRQAAVTAEATTRAAADTVLRTAIATEVTDRTAADTVLRTAVNTEVTERKAADTVLQTAITTEVADRKAAVTAEETARVAGDVSLRTAITTESTTRAAAVAAETTARTAAVSTLTNNLAAEASARQAADLALGTRIDGVNARVGALETRVDSVARAASAGTAVAVALSGGAFLPDVKYNLTANVATYDGAHAVAAQFGAMVSKNFAVNAGVATSLNRGGKTAARAGFTFGW